MKYCEEYAALLDLFVDGELSLDEMIRVQEHLDTCPTCQSYVDDALAMQAAFPDADEEAVPEGFAAGVMTKIRSAGVVTPTKKKKTPWVGLVASLAACCAIVIIQQNGPMAGGNESATASMAYDTAVAEEAACDDAALDFSYYTADSTTEETAEEPVAEAEEDAPMERQMEDGVSPENAVITDTTATSTPKETAVLDAANMWLEGENVVFACVVFLPENRVGSVLDGYEGKPYVTDEGIVGTGYALEQAEFEEILYDSFDYTHGPELDSARTTDLCCIVVTE